MSHLRVILAGIYLGVCPTVFVFLSSHKSAAFDAWFEWSMFTDCGRIQLLFLSYLLEPVVTFLRFHILCRVWPLYEIWVPTYYRIRPQLVLVRMLLDFKPHIVALGIEFLEMQRPASVSSKNHPNPAGFTGKAPLIKELIMLKRFLKHFVFVELNPPVSKPVKRAVKPRPKRSSKQLELFDCTEDETSC